MATSPSYNVNMTLRQLINAILTDDSDVKAFCLDMFPDIYQRISSGMDRILLVNIILQHIKPATLIKSLRDYRPYQCALYAEKENIPAELRAQLLLDHFAFRKTQDFFEIPKNYILINTKEIGLNCWALMRLSKHVTLASLLNDFYINYLRDIFPPFTYGKKWAICNYDCEPGFSVILPWSWLLNGRLENNWLFETSPHQIGINEQNILSVITVPNKHVFGIALWDSKIFNSILDDVKSSDYLISGLVAIEQDDFESEKYPYRAIIYDGGRSRPVHQGTLVVQQEGTVDSITQNSLDWRERLRLSRVKNE